MLTVVTFKWKPAPGYRSVFGPESVNTLYRMVDRQYTRPHRNVCITDDPRGFDPSIEVIPLWGEFGDIPSPHGGHNPSCYRRLKLFSAEIETLLGKRFVAIDLDTVIVGNLEPLWDRQDDFVIWGETDPRSWYNGSMFLMTAGARRQVYDTFDPVRSPRLAFNAGRFGSDQGWISHVLGPGEARWGRGDGVVSYRKHVRPKPGRRLPVNARVVFFHGIHDPWGPEAQKLPWVREHYH